MANYFVGDIQGCYSELIRLLERLAFNPSADTLWSVGDMVARGPDSLETLRFLSQLEGSANVVLGNHDLHLLALEAGIKRPNPKDRLTQLLEAEDLPDLTHWLRQQPLVRYEQKHNVIMSHAGVYPLWDLSTLLEQSEKVSLALKSDDYVENIIAKMYHDKPSHWQLCETEFEQLLFTIDACTRMRYLHLDGSLNFSCKLPPAECDDPSLLPWFKMPNPSFPSSTLVFGHWAALLGRAEADNLQALDTGCVWGGEMTIWHLETNEKITQKRLK